EVVWVGNRPVALYTQDSPPSTVADEHGNITGYAQVTDYGRRVEFEPREIIHVSLDSARPGIFPESPMQAAMGPITAWLFAAATGQETFKKGRPPEIHVDFPAGTQDGDIRNWRDQHLTRNVGSKNIGTRSPPRAARRSRNRRPAGSTRCSRARTKREQPSCA